MQIDEFLLLIDDVKQDIIFKHGVFLENYEQGHFICDAYKLFDFYVVCCFVYNKERRPVIVAGCDRHYLPFVRSGQAKANTMQVVS